MWGCPLLNANKQYISDGFLWGSPRFKTEEIIIPIFFIIQSRHFGGLFTPSLGFWKTSEGNTMWHYPSFTLPFLSKPWRRREQTSEMSALNNKKDRYKNLSFVFLNLKLPHQNPFNSLTSPSPKTTSIMPWFILSILFLEVQIFSYRKELSRILRFWVIMNIWIQTSKQTILENYFSQGFKHL